MITNSGGGRWDDGLLLEGMLDVDPDDPSDLPVRGAAFLLALSSNITADPGDATTAQLTAPAGKSTSDFDAGRLQDDANPFTTAVDVSTDDYSELEWCIEAVAGVVIVDEVYQFRVELEAGGVLDTYTVTPEWTIGEGAPAESGASSVTAAGVVASTETTNRNGTSSARAAGAVTSADSKQATATSACTAAGVVNSQTSTPETHTGTSAATSSARVVSVGRKASLSASVVTVGASVTSQVTTPETHTGTSAVTSSARVVSQVRKASLSGSTVSAAVSSTITTPSSGAALPVAARLAGGPLVRAQVLASG